MNVPNSEFFLTSPFQLNLALALLRIAIGLCFIVHGLGKLGLVGPGNMTGFESWLKSLNVPFPHLQARMAMACELGGGFLLATGLAFRWGCVFLFLTMSVAILIGHRGGGYLITNNPPGNEYALNLAIICIVLFLTGPGKFSLDYWLSS